MNPDMLLYKHILYACLGGLIGCLWLTFGHAQAVSLSITGHCVGSGILSMNYTGDALNVSLLQNGTAWLINATTGAA
jgi:hypothetical protein